ncbi:MAG: capsular polysaccharide biosynthesis protein CapF [Clostridiales bacterium]|nr:capsular polysaccharide biosynthesis protein CapF [Clostridiales bacterium]
MNVLITGAKGFIGRNLVEALKAVRDGKDKSRGFESDITIYECDIDTDAALLDTYTEKCDFVFHLAGVNRPKDEREFMEGNFGFTSTLLELLKKHENKAPVLITSSIQAALDNPYGRSKKAGEDLLFKYGEDNGVKVCVYRFPNVFGKWCRPNYNSAVATFCYNIAHNLPITVNDRNHLMTLVYIDDVVDELINALKGEENRDGDYCAVPIEHKITLGEIADLIYSFKKSREDLSVPDMTDGSFSKKLYSTFLSYLDTTDFAYKLRMNCDERGSFTEILRTADRGQFSVNISKPGITKGQHWHNTKNEKFIVVKGHGLIQLRKIGSDDVIEYDVSGDEITVVDMIPGYTHNIINLSDTEDLVTIMWANECFNPNKPDTFFEEV